MLALLLLWQNGTAGCVGPVSEQPPGPHATPQESTSGANDRPPETAAASAQPEGVFAPMFRRETMSRTGALDMSARPAGMLTGRTDDFAQLNGNRFADVGQSPLSTFSVDVDTAAYAIVRRHLRNEQLPPSDAVRIEELINYFDYGYPSPAPGEALAMSTAVGTCPWEPANILVQIGLATRALPTAELPPTRLVFLLDVSGSMESPDRLPLLKRALHLLVEQLRPEDRVAIVVYAGAAGVVLPSTPGNEKAAIFEALENLRAGGSTAGAAGIQLAYQTAHQQFSEEGINRIVLATDGDFNVGVSDAGSLVDIVEAERQTGVSLTVLGFGLGNLQDRVLEQLAAAGSASYQYVDSLAEARRTLVSQLGATLTTVALDVKVQVEFNPAQVSRYRLLGYENRRLQAEDFDDDEVDAAEMGAGHTVTALYEVVPQTGRPISSPLRYQEQDITPGEHSDELMHVSVRYKRPGSDTSALMEQAVNTAAAPRARISTESFALAAGVAEFGLLLQETTEAPGARYDRARRNAETARQPAADGRIAELVELITAAEALTRQQ